MKPLTIVQRIARCSLYLCAAITISALVAALLGHRVTYQNEIMLPYILRYTVSFALYAVNFELMASFVLAEGLRGHWRMTAAVLAVRFVTELFIVSFLTSALLPIAAVLITCFLRGEAKKRIARLAIWTAFAYLFPIVALWVKSDILNLSSVHGTSAVNAWLQAIDVIIASIYMNATGGVNYVGLVVRAWFRHRRLGELVCFAETVDVCEKEEVEAAQALREMSHTERAAVGKKISAFTVAQLAVIFFVCFIGNVLIEGIIVTISFCAIGQIIKRRWHANSGLLCTAISCAMFYAAAKLFPPFSALWFPLVAVALGLVYGFYQIAVYTETARGNAEKIKNQNAFALVKGCDYSRMKEIASAKGLTDWDIQLLKGRYCEGLSWRDMCDAFHRVGSESTIKRHVNTAVRKFEES